MKFVIKALPWALLFVIAVIFASVYPPIADNESVFYYDFKKIIIAMLLGGLFISLGSGVTDGIVEGLDSRNKPQPPPRP